jgi:hypothetical protein
VDRERLVVHFMKSLLPIIILVFFVPASLSFTTIPGTAEKRVVLSDYQKDVISYFKEIALGYEYGTASSLTRKWKQNVRVFLDGTEDTVLSDELQRVAQELNELATDGFQVEIVQSRAESNVHIFVGTASQFARYYPTDRVLAASNSGIFRVYWNSKNEIFRGHIFISNSTSREEQRHAIREELTQCLGLGRDSETHQESIFQLRYTTPTEFAPIDRELIRLLYHPSMHCGMTALEAEAVLTDILLSENEL